MARGWESQCHFQTRTWDIVSVLKFSFHRDNGKTPHHDNIKWVGLGQWTLVLYYLSRTLHYPHLVQSLSRPFLNCWQDDEQWWCSELPLEGEMVLGLLKTFIYKINRLLTNFIEKKKNGLEAAQTSIFFCI